jgi:hypothetical protein
METFLELLSLEHVEHVVVCLVQDRWVALRNVVISSIRWRSELRSLAPATLASILLASKVRRDNGDHDDEKLANYEQLLIWPVSGLLSLNVAL